MGGGFVHFCSAGDGKGTAGLALLGGAGGSQSGNAGDGAGGGQPGGGAGGAGGPGNYAGGGGGGGGWCGGAGSSFNGNSQGGGGGSGYVAPNGVSPVNLTATNSTPPMQTDPDYASAMDTTALGGAPDTAGGAGRVVVRYVLK